MNGTAFEKEIRAMIRKRQSGVGEKLEHARRVFKESREIVKTRQWPAPARQIRNEALPKLENWISLIREQVPQKDENYADVPEFQNALTKFLQIEGITWRHPKALWLRFTHLVMRIAIVVLKPFTLIIRLVDAVHGRNDP